jgi:hypothetical protein
MEVEALAWNLDISSSQLCGSVLGVIAVGALALVYTATWIDL